MAIFKNVYELADERKKKGDFVSAMQELKTDNYGNANNNKSSFADQFNSGYAQAGGQGNGLNNLSSAFGKKMASFGNKGSSGFGTIGSAANDYIMGSGNTGSAITNAINGTDTGSPISNAINNYVNNGESSFASKFGSGSSSGGTPWGLIGGVAKQGYNSISGHDDKDYSDTEESIVYPLQGASMGAQFGPWGAVGGALYGLGYSFKDDLGLKDSNFLTQMLFPIGMGDGGGLRIGGESVLDLG